ncbi:MAG: DUF3105 domain-containing protein, partial [Actinobacteria bacterium]|nr:DUF3105 domain-containing protein [Actinomycetota bacterium]
MSSRQEEKEQRKQERLAREAAAAKAVKRKRLLQLIGGVVVACAIIAGVVFAVGGGGGDGGGGDGDGADLAEAARAAGCVYRSFPDEGREHTAEKLTADDFDTNPPTSGPHNPTPAPDGIYAPGNEPAIENWVHTLEHGSVGLLYQPDLELEQIRDLEAIVGEYDGQVFSMPYTGGMQSPITIAAWGHTMELDEVEEDSIEQFIEENRRPLDDLRVLWERLHPDGPVTVRIGSFAVDGVETWPRLLDAVADVRRAAGDERAAVLVRRDVGCVVGGVLPRRGAPVIVSGDPSGIADGLLSPVPTRLVGRGGGLRGADRARLLALRLTASRRL